MEVGRIVRVVAVHHTQTGQAGLHGIAPGRVVVEIAIEDHCARHGGTGGCVHGGSTSGAAVDQAGHGLDGKFVTIAAQPRDDTIRGLGNIGMMAEGFPPPDVAHVDFDDLARKG
ncbi:hypothetical protein G6F54_014263 [Rhizopus delemar]|nr:hypothetical protein G6F54_014263 [Rhizopus delemar]